MDLHYDIGDNKKQQQGGRKEVERHLTESDRVRHQ